MVAAGEKHFYVRPHWIVALFVVCSLTLPSVLASLGGAARLYWFVTFMGFVLYLPALTFSVNLARAPGFVIVLIIFLASSLTSTLLQFGPPIEILAGVKRYFPAFGLLLLFALYPLSKRNFTFWKKLLLFIAAIQLPFALYQFLVMVPLRGGLRAGSGAVTDVVAGSFGMNLEGGSLNSVMAVFLLIVLSFMLSWWKEGLLDLRRIILALPFLLLPIGLGEVKIVFVMIPLLFLVLFKDQFTRRPAFFLSALVLVGILISLLAYALAEFIMQIPIDRIIEDTITYNTSDEQGYGTNFLNRITVLSFWWQQQGLHDPIGFVFGHGIGSSHVTANALVPGHMAMKWPSYGIGLTTASQLLWDTGIFGFTLFCIVLALAWLTAEKIRKLSDSRSAVADAAAIQSAVMLFSIMLPYNPSLIVELPMQVMYALVLGYLAYLYRNEKTVSDGGRKKSIFPVHSAARPWNRLAPDRSHGHAYH